MDSPWLYVLCAHKLHQPQRGTVEFSSELTTRRLLNIQSLTLQGLYKDRKGEKEARLNLFTPTISYLKVDKPTLNQNLIGCHYTCAYPATS